MRVCTSSSDQVHVAELSAWIAALGPERLHLLRFEQGTEADYEQEGYFGEHKFALFGKDRKRVLIEAEGSDDLVAYPLRASARPGARKLSQLPIGPPAPRSLGSRRMGRF